MKLAGIVILYNPDGKLLERIHSYKKHLKRLYIVDNSSELNRDLLQPITGDDVFIVHDGSNEGISKRLNQVAAKAIEEGYDWLLTMDQDSQFGNGSFTQYLICITNYTNLKQVALFGIEYDERLRSNVTDCPYKKVSHLITSGSIVNLDLFNNIGGFDENLFIDHVDHEYCFRAILHGYEIIKLDNILLQHALGVVSNYRSLKDFKITSRALHAPIRLYYMVRNYLYLNRKYSVTFKEDMVAFRKHLLNNIKNNLLYNQERSSVASNIIKGYRDFNKGKMGKAD